MNSKLLAIHLGHDCSVTLVDKNDQLRIFELERFVKIRSASFADIINYEVLGPTDKKDFLFYIKSQLKEEPKYVLHSYGSDDDVKLLKKFFPNSKFIWMGHHTSHCIGAYQQSGFKDALVISMDGGGVEFNHYGISEEKGGEEIGYCILTIKDKKVKVLSTSSTIKNPDSPDITPGQYASPSLIISEIEDKDGRKLNHFGGLFDDNRKYVGAVYQNRGAGKLMGMAAYGKVRDEIIEPFRFNYKINPSNAHSPKFSMMMWYYFANILKDISDIHDILELRPNCVSGQNSFDLAATNQYVFEELCFELIKPYIDECDLDVVFSGGCALNVLFNQKVAKYLNERNRKLFVTPTPGDEGLSYGHICSIDKTINKSFSVYCGVDIIDRERIPEYYDRYKKENKVIDMDVTKIVDLIKDGKIGATMIGYSEVGPRALGNRSIICDPSIAEMKDTLNAKVKFREWFRPFAPVCREEDKDKYFDDAFVSPYMTFSPSVKEEYRQRLPAITHVDGTARLQTVTRDQHELFYDILTELDNRGHDAVILNTSFNIKGKPILTTVEDAFYVLENTELDFLILEEYLFLK